MKDTTSAILDLENMYLTDVAFAVMQTSPFVNKVRISVLTHIFSSMNQSFEHECYKS